MGKMTNNEIDDTLEEVGSVGCRFDIKETTDEIYRRIVKASGERGASRMDLSYGDEYGNYNEFIVHKGEGSLNIYVDSYDVYAPENNPYDYNQNASYITIVDGDKGATVYFEKDKEWLVCNCEKMPKMTYVPYSLERENVDGWEALGVESLAWRATAELQTKKNEEAQKGFEDGVKQEPDEISERKDTFLKNMAKDMQKEYGEIDFSDNVHMVSYNEITEEDHNYYIDECYDVKSVESEEEPDHWFDEQYKPRRTIEYGALTEVPNHWDDGKAEEWLNSGLSKSEFEYYGKLKEHFEKGDFKGKGKSEIKETVIEDLKQDGIIKETTKDKKSLLERRKSNYREVQAAKGRLNVDKDDHATEVKESKVSSKRSGRDNFEK